MANVLRKIPQLVKNGINPCGNHFCLCVEYLDFGKEKDQETYHHCFTTQEKNLRYLKQEDLIPFESIQMKFR